MGTLDERVAFIEGQMAEQGHAFLAMRDALRDLGQHLGQRIDRIDERLDRVDRRIDRLEQRMEAGFAAVDRRFALFEQRFEALDGKMSRQFLWMVGIQVTILLAVLGTVLMRG